METASPAASSAGLTILEPELRRASDLLSIASLVLRLLAAAMACVFVLMTMVVARGEIFGLRSSSVTYGFAGGRVGVGGGLLRWTQFAGRGPADSESRLVALLDLVVDFLPVNGHVRRGFDAELDEVAFRAHDLH